MGPQGLLCLLVCAALRPTSAYPSYLLLPYRTQNVVFRSCCSRITGKHVTKTTEWPASSENGGHRDYYVCNLLVPCSCHGAYDGIRNRFYQNIS